MQSMKEKMLTQFISMLNRISRTASLKLHFNSLSNEGWSLLSGKAGGICCRSASGCGNPSGPISEIGAVDSEGSSSLSCPQDSTNCPSASVGRGEPSGPSKRPSELVERGCPCSSTTLPGRPEIGVNLV